MHLEGAQGTIYQGEKYTLKIRFTDDYPMDSPEVVFIPPSPIHPHIYSNGHICLNILGIIFFFITILFLLIIIY